MTTIAANRHCMAADSLIVDNGTRSYGDKIYEIKGDIVGIAGDFGQALIFVEWYRDRRKRQPYLADEDGGGEFEALVLTKKGELHLWTNNMICHTIKDDFWAIGSGRDAALAIMHFGETPTTAVEVAKKVNAETDGEVKTVYRK